VAAPIPAAADFMNNPPSRNIRIVRVVWIVAVNGCAGGCGFAGCWVAFQIQFVCFASCGGRIPLRFLRVLFLRDRLLSPLSCCRCWAFVSMVCVFLALVWQRMGWLQIWTFFLVVEFQKPVRVSSFNPKGSGLINP